MDKKRKLQTTLFRHLIRKKTEHLFINGMMGNKRDTGLREKIMKGIA